ncbi:MAG: hypothetical protein R3F37_00330 [Candidatus Competibacteraceae bacterium]
MNDVDNFYVYIEDSIALFVALVAVFKRNGVFCREYFILTDDNSEYWNAHRLIDENPYGSTEEKISALLEDGLISINIKIRSYLMDKHKETNNRSYIDIAREKPVVRQADSSYLRYLYRTGIFSDSLARIKDLTQCNSLQTSLSDLLSHPTFKGEDIL